MCVYGCMRVRASHCVIGGCHHDIHAAACLVERLLRSLSARSETNLCFSLLSCFCLIGSHTECQYKLMTFGLPVNHFPVTYEGELKTAGHLKWLARRQIREEALQSVGTFRGIDIPGSKDALFGRGKTIQDHNGNVLMRSLIEEYMPEYRRAAKKEKGKVAWKVVMATKALGGRFLKRDSTGWWVEVTDEIAREKISMTYRTSRSTDSPYETNVVEQPRVDHGQNKEDDNDAQVIERDSKRSRRKA